MTFITYAQNYEDVMLWRALKHVERGFYIDVGANDPIIDSVTKAFYDRGWSGINIEPLPSHHADIAKERPRDLNLQCAVGAASGSIDVWDCGVRGWGTAAPEVISSHLAHRRQGSFHRVELLPLHDICHKHVRGEIHFLKIDVEGFEKAVIEGMDFSRFRPWILVIEATRPNSSQEVHAHWEPILLAHNYRFAYADGINRFYVAQEHADLLEAFRHPPNALDDFQRLAHFRADVKSLETEDKLQLARQEAEQLKVRALQAEAALQHLQEHLSGLYASKSWRVTEPLRWVMDHYRKLKHTDFRRRVSSLLEKMRHRLDAIDSSPNHRVQSPAALGLFPPETLVLPKVKKDRASWVRLTGHIEGHYSLAIVNRGLAGALESVNDQRLVVIPYDGIRCTHSPDLSSYRGAPSPAAFERQVPDAETSATLSVVHHYPPIVDDQPSGQRGIIFFWEETAVPANVISHINAGFDLVWVAARSVKQALLNSGCRIPVFVIPIGVDHLVTSSTNPLHQLAVPPGGRLRFLHVSSAFARKGTDVLIGAFLDAFTADDAVELYIKTFPNPHNRTRELLDALTAKFPNPAHVTIDEAPLQPDEMIALYRSAHAMVLPSRGEGFNLPAAEALAMGLPVITTGAGGQADFCSAATATLVGYQLALSGSHVRTDDACWLEPDRGDLSAKLQMMRRRILQRDVTLERQRRNGLHHVRNTYTWTNGAHALLSSAHWLSEQSGTRPAPLNLALISPWSTRCGIAEYSMKLLGPMIGSSDIELSVYCDNRTTVSGTDTGLRWSMGDNASVICILQHIERTSAHVVLMQHQPSLFSLSDDICMSMLELHRQGKVVVLELHSTLQILMERQLSPRAIAALAGIDRIIVHQPADLNHLLTLGLADNVMLLNHGVLQALAKRDTATIRSELGIPADALVLGSFGFAMAHKGIDTLVHAIKPMAQASGRHVHLIAVNSAANEHSERLIRQYQAHSRYLGVETCIHWISDFQPIERCQELLGAADYIVYPYKQTRESASGAVTIGLSALRPVIVSPSSIFSDLAEVTWRMRGHEAHDIVSAVLALESMPDEREVLLDRQLAWLKARDWRVLSARLHTLMKALCHERRLAAAIAPPQDKVAADTDQHPTRQMLVDISELYHRDARTGIQRVVRSVLGELIDYPPRGFRICPVYADKGDCFRYTSKFIPHPVDPKDGEPVEVTAGDVFLGLDLSAHLFPEAEEQLRRFRDAGARVYFMVYDIIPLRYPEFTTANMPQAFEIWLRALARSVDGLICISGAVAADVRSWLREHMPDTLWPMVGFTHLGADIHNSRPSVGLPPNADSLLEKKGVGFLMVGTIEPRKGHSQTLDAFEKLWAAGSDSRLMLVGKLGWNMDSFAERLAQHPEAGRRLIWLQGASDEFLQMIYSRSDCLIAASQCEGFGLPLIEAAQYGLAVIARDIPVFREVAGAHAHYFSGLSTDALADAVSEWLALYQTGQHPRSDNMPWLSWKESTRRLLHLMDVHTPCQ